MTVGAVPLCDPASRRYVDDVLNVLGELADVEGAFLVGSAARGAFDAGKSDLDLVVVLARPLGAKRDAFVERLRGLPCPARNLELVAYVRGQQPPNFELNVSGGEERPDEDPFWFILDAALAQEHALPLRGGAAWSDFFAPVAGEAIRAALHASLAWSERRPSDDRFARVHGVRARHYLEHGEWISKDQASVELAP